MSELNHQWAICPRCKAERLDYEGQPNKWLPECPNCQSTLDPIVKRYERMKVDMALTFDAVAYALDLAGWQAPKLFVAEGAAAQCHEFVGSRFALEIREDPALSGMEWYVAWGDKAVGTIGC